MRGVSHEYKHLNSPAANLPCLRQEKPSAFIQLKKEDPALHRNDKLCPFRNRF